MKLIVQLSAVALIWACIGALLWVCASIHEIVLELRAIADYYRGPKSVTVASPINLKLIYQPTPEAKI